MDPKEPEDPNVLNEWGGSISWVVVSGGDGFCSRQGDKYLRKVEIGLSPSEFSKKKAGQIFYVCTYIMKYVNVYTYTYRHVCMYICGDVHISVICIYI